MKSIMHSIKKSFLLLLTLMSFQVSANDGKFTATMQKNIKAIYEAKEIPAFQESVNAFERIAAVEKERWEPLYYIAYGNIMMANFEREGSKIDGYLDRALESIKKAKALAPEEGELFSLEGFALMLRIGVDPQSRGMSFAPQATQAFSKALSIDPKNPRALALMAQMQFGTAQFFGSPVTEACSMNEKAIESFGTYKNDNVLAPVWGLGMAQSLKTRCQ